ncbi:S53 family peptidase [Actinocrispum wychmicini]|uniref:Subtilase family protein n=1 Tax=Actinocrispum wychmicini TaxID=1213861 RepID=A0A4R2JCQ5_9PSEU|nr:S53 family peptidase [Actinocrispum wychmicini]TCO56684.1 subtilase family protein [Actinocrispum wychmicini]
MRKTLALSVALVAMSAAAVPATAAPSGRSVIPQSHPQWAQPQSKVADSPAGDRLSFRVYLAPRDQQGAEATAQAVSDPDSPSYRQYLTPAQVLARYAPTSGAVKQVSDWLAGGGFSVGEVPANNAYVEATGTIDQTQRAFGVHLGKYKVQGKTLRASDTDLSVPASVSSVVAGVIGVDNAMSLMTPKHVGGRDEINAAQSQSLAAPTAVPPPAGFRNAPPCSSFWAEKTDITDPVFNGQHLPYAPCGYKPGQLRSAYGLDGLATHGIDGRGVTVGIVDAFASPTLFADAAEYAKRNDPAHPLRPSQFRQFVYPPTPGQEDPDVCDAAGWYGEQSLDVEAVHAMAPGANIFYVGGADCQDLSLDKALNRIIARHEADIVSNSYGNTGEDIPADEVGIFERIAIHAAIEGIGVYFSSGDNGDESFRLPQPSPDFSASSPWVTAVGGTSLGIGRDGRKVVETGWETDRSVLADGTWGAPTYLYGSGGSTSRLFAEPFYQRGVVPDALARQNQTGNARGRVVPDISMVGDPNTGMLIGITQTFPEGAHYDQYRIGGTSLSSPLLAGEVAVADQLRGFHHGFINPVLYKFTSHTFAVTDVKHVDSGVVRVDYKNGLDPSGGFNTTARVFDTSELTIHTTRGYDNVTGLGAPNGSFFLALI